MFRSTFKAVLSISFVLSTASHAQEVQNIEEYNEKLPVWGISWKPGNRSVNGYYPSFYTGFAPRMQTPNRLHVRLSRGNQTRTSAILDESTVMDYLYDLKARSDFYQELVDGEYINTSPNGSDLTPHLAYFQSIVRSGILSPIEAYNSGSIEKEELYLESLAALKELNPGRVFDIKINLAEEYLNWREQFVMADYSAVNTDSSSQEAMVLANLMLVGRINMTRALSPDELEILKNLVENASVLSDEGFVMEADRLFDSITDSKYAFKKVDSETQQFVDVKVCTGIDNCKLNYPEMSAIYPTGSLKAGTRDRNGNTISRYATPGLHAFIDTGSRGDVDNIRRESYYGFAPKMDYEAIGNGFHNPAVRLWIQGQRSLKEAMNISSEHTIYWPVKRGRVSSGCSRLPLAHIWEMRQMFPVQNSLMKEVYYFGNDSRDFDLYDIDGDGLKEVMGVMYYISYNTQGSSGLAKREGQDLSLNDDTARFFRSLYGANDVFTEDQGAITILNPVISVQTINDRWTGSSSSGRVRASQAFLGEYPLYEQAYEQDKAQFYTSYKVRNFNGLLTGGGKESLGKRFVRLLGRVKGCAPFSDVEACGSKAFEDEKAQIFAEIN